MATDCVSVNDHNESKEKVLSDVHICLLHSENIDKGKDCQERQKWLSRFHFWLPQIPDKMVAPVGTLYTPTVQKDIFINDPCSLNRSDEKQTHDSLKKEFLKLDEDGDMILVRRQTQCLSENSPGDNKQNRRTINHPHALDYVADVLLPLTKSDDSSPKHHITESIGDVSLELEQHKLFIIRDRKCENALYSDADVECCKDLHINKTVISDRKVTEQCQGKTHLYSDVINSQQHAHQFSLNIKRLDEDTNTPQNHIVSINEVRQDVGVLTLEHSLETSLPEVGFQVWSGGLLLCDYLIHNHRDLENAVVLDLGAGTGVTSIVAAMFAPCVLCTDYLSSIVALCERNWKRNKQLLPTRACNQMYFKVLNWMCDWTLQDAVSESRYDITTADLKLIDDAAIILAAEVIYDEELTDGFFRTIYRLFMKSSPKTVLLTIERRIVFSAENQDIYSPAYEHFLENLKDLTTVDEGPVYFSVEKISTAFPQYFHYERLKELELWKISSHLQVPV